MTIADSPLRIIAGDLLVVPRLFQNAPDAAGLAIVRSYQLLQPMRIVRPSGGQSFQLSVPSSVDILVNGRSARRLRLEPGNYNVRDFPFAQGGNDIRVLVDQGAGPREVLHYSVFYDTAQLAARAGRVRLLCRRQIRSRAERPRIFGRLAGLRLLPARTSPTR